jgi:hypothetical protein
MSLIDLFASQRHSGYSASWAIDLFAKLANYENITPLTSDPEEWMLVDDDMWQNLRNSECFSTDGGVTYYKLSTGRDTIYRSE